MKVCKKLLHVLLRLSLLSCVSSQNLDLSSLSLWGKMADFTRECSYWQLSPDLPIPALEELSVCLHLQQHVSTPTWTAFMYRHPDGMQAELGLAGQDGLVYTWLFGKKWSTPVHLPIGHWHYICVTWSGTSHPPTLYINGSRVNYTTDDVEFPPSPLGYRLARNGTLTLGVSHYLIQGEMHVKNKTKLNGRVSLFRMWGEAHTAEQVALLNCTEGDIIRWDSVYWLTQSSLPIPDSHLHCEWSLYEVKFTMIISCIDGNSTDAYKTRDLADQWLRLILPSHKYHLYRVSVQVSTWPFFSNDNGETNMERDEPKSLAKSSSNWFDCLVHLNVIPSSDVSNVQKNVSQLLNNKPLNTSSLTLTAISNSIQVNSVEQFPPATVSPFISTTTDFMVTTVGPTSDIFFEVNINVTLTESSDDPGFTIYTWLSCIFIPPDMSLLTYKFMEKSYSVQHPSPLSNKIDSVWPAMLEMPRYGCLFQVQVTTSSTQEETKNTIQTLLEKKYTNGAINIELKSEDIHIRHILLESCPETRHQTRKGLFVWPVTMALQTANLSCQGNPNKTATRHCQLGFPISWNPPDMQQCVFVVLTIPDLEDIEVTSENAMDVLEIIESLLQDHPDLNSTELDTVLNKLKQIVFVSWMTPPLGKAILNIISDILESKSYLELVTNQILNITEMIGDKMFCFDQSNYTLVSSGIAVTSVIVDPNQFQRLTFGVSFASESLNPEIYLNKDPSEGTVAFVTLPSPLKYRFPQHNGSQPRVQFQFYGIKTLFMNNPNGTVLNTYVVSASVTNASGPIKDLEKDVEVTLYHRLSNPLGKDVHCVYWDFNQNEGEGGWNGRGCRMHTTSADYTTCLCDHLTHFGVLLDISRNPIDIPNEEILTLITYLGCGVSSLFLGITVLTYAAFEKLRRDYPSKILINLSLALLGLNMVFLVNSWLSSVGSSGLCVAVASTLHYFLLASFTWMGLEAVHMYFALVKVFNVYVPSYILKFCVLGWGIPLVICCVVLVVNRESYGSGGESMEPFINSNEFCWIQDEVAFYVSVVGYLLLVLLCNLAIFVVVLVQIRHMRINHPVGIRSSLLLQDLKGVSSLTFLLGLTWTVAFFAWGPAKVPFLYLFCILNSLQGFFIFLFHCLMKENVRKQWRIHLCFGRFRLQEYSEWSQTGTFGAKHKSNPPIRLPSVRSIKSSSTDSTSASSNSSQRQVSIRRPSLDCVYKKSLAIPRVQLISNHLPPKRRFFPEEETWPDRSHQRHQLPIA
ncbi:hypothetical protein UPYG_G00115510 [Umbra pygmaea]|uniref:Adhesion G-protein coupled receptor G4 n=1 Tax=Umbra pygmaea TaxID=75934 RepID=A0ABD0X4L5_UMBPY